MIRRTLLGLFLFVLAALPSAAQFNGCVAGFCSSSTQWVFPGATLDLDFANNRYFGVANGINSLTTTRVSTGYAQALNGTWVNFGNNIARRTDRGLLVEESRTNSIRNNSMQGAVVGSPGTLPTNWISVNSGLTRTIVGTGVESGIEYIDIRFNGTTSGTEVDIAFAGATTIAALQNQTWTGGAFVAIVGGSLTNISTFRNFIIEADAGGSTLAGTTSNFTPTNASLTSQRRSLTYTLANASTAFVYSRVDFLFANGVAIDITLRIGWPQLELGAFATSPIRTTNAASTRAADSISLPVGSWYNASAGTMYAAGNPYVGTLATPAAFQIGSTPTRFVVSLPGVGQLAAPATVLISNVGQTSFVNVTGVSPAKVAFAYAQDDFAAAYNTALQTDNSGNLPTVGATAYIGTNIANYYSGYITRVAYSPFRNSNANLQSITQ